MRWLVIRRPTSIAGRLLIFSGVFVTLALVVASIVLWFALKTVIREQVDQRLDTQIAALEGALTEQGGRLVLSAPLDAPPFDRPGSGWYWQIDGQGQHLSSRSLLGKTIDAPPPRADFVHMITSMPVPGDGEEHGRKLYLRQSFRTVDGISLVITATAPQRALIDPAVNALLWLAPCMLVLGVVLMGGTLWQIRYGLRPLKSMAAAIDEINRGERLHLPDEPTAELASLSLKTNALIQSNGERLAATRIQFANLAHGLKTPVAGLLLALGDQNDLDGSLRDLVMRIDSRIRHHLSAASRVMSASGPASRTDVATVVADLHEAISRIYFDRTLRFESSIMEGMSVACDEQDVEEMCGNLMDNAFKWASSHVGVTAMRDGPLVQIVFEDDGPGIPKDRLHTVVLPGAREDERMPGDGFGLSIVTEIANLYGGSLSMEANEPGGLRAVLSLPVATSLR